jgi:Fe2+ or Zn2+ uptake regulation protein
MLETLKVPIKADLPRCNCGSLRYTRVRMETMETVFDHLECDKCGKLYMVKRTRKEDALRENKERDEIFQRQVEGSCRGLCSSRPKTRT